jgi:hypothetical protein
MNLAAIQQDFRAWLVSGTEEAAARFAPEARAGLSVYQNNYRASLMACWQRAFPGLECGSGNRRSAPSQPR